ncbi:MAG: deoxyhypusine synthase family protein, partial [Acidobacteriota bacterium]
MSGPRIRPRPVHRRLSVRDLVEEHFLAFNAARLREGCELFARRMLEKNVTVGMSLTGALTPAGLGMSCLIPLVRSGMVDWVVSTGANLYHDAHFGIGLSMHRGQPNLDDRLLRE